MPRRRDREAKDGRDEDDGQFRWGGSVPVARQAASRVRPSQPWREWQVLRTALERPRKNCRSQTGERARRTRARRLSDHLFNSFANLP